MPPNDPNSDPLIGAAVGNYRIERLVGEGGMGRVYEALQPEIGARVAIKVIAEEIAVDEQMKSRFFAEARAVNVIRHERIVKIHDLTQLGDGRPCIIMEFLEGTPLDELIERHGPLPLGTAARVAEEVLDALEATHAQGIVHRDLKPANIFVTPEGHAKLVDFGIAKLGSEIKSHETALGTIVGTVPYMSPEQARGEDIDARTDLFALGVVLYEATTAKRPFPTENVFALADLHRDGPVPPRRLRPEMSETYEGLIVQALEINPGRRFATAGAMRSALQSIQEALPDEAFDIPSDEGRVLEGRTSGATEAQWGGLAGAASEPTALAVESAAEVAPRARRVSATAETAMAETSDAHNEAGTTSVEVPVHRRGQTAPPKPRTPWLVIGLGIGLLALLWFGVRSFAGEATAPPAAKADGSAVQPPPKSPQVMTMPPMERPIEPRRALAESIEVAGTLARGATPVWLRAEDVDRDGLARGEITVALNVAPQRQGPCTLVVFDDGTERSLGLRPLEEVECGAPAIAPQCSSKRVRAVLAAAGANAESINLVFADGTWTLTSDEGRMQIDDRLCVSLQ